MNRLMFLDPRGRRELILLVNDLPGTKLIASHDLALVPRYLFAGCPTGWGKGREVWRD